jgi:glycosyltransferase involved in cell wall biosynthesis
MPRDAPGSSTMRIAVIDPSLFTIPYDDALCDALALRGGVATLFGRRLRAGETRSGTAPLEPFFYRAVERRSVGLPLRAFRMAKGVEHAIDMVRLSRRLARERPEIIHFQWAPLPVVDRRFIAALRRIAPVVLTVHDTTPFNGSPNEALQGIGATSIYAAFDHLIVHTEAGRAQLVAHGIDPRAISVIAHGPLDLPTAPSGAPYPWAAEVGPGGERAILAFGKIKPYKGIDLLIEAFARLPETLRAGAKLRIVGEPFMPLEPLQARARELGVADRITWELRYVRDDEIGGIIGAADILAFPYRQIDASGVLMVALRYGKPIIASGIGAFAELLRDGEHGRLVPPENVPALRDALAELLADPVRAAAMGEKVRGIAGGIPNWPEIADATLALYRRLIARTPSALAAPA